MKLILIAGILFALVFGYVGYSLAETTPVPLTTRVAKLEKKVKSLTAGHTAHEIRIQALSAENASLLAQVHQLQADELVAAQAEDNLRVRVEKLEDVVYHQGNP